MPHAESCKEMTPNVKVHSEISADLDYDHASALETLLKDCTDEQLISEIARRKLDLQHKVTSELVAKYYHFEKLLGHGASGKVYLVYHRETGEKFACKVIKKDGSMNDAQSMTTEIEIMKRIRHRYIVSLYELFESAQCMWLILELVEGTGLRGVLASSSHYSEEVASRYVKQMLSGIHYLHNHGVIHRDLKIDNMLLHGDLETGMVKIADFGLSALIRPGTKGYHLDESQKRKGFTGLTEMWGTPTHYSPELINKMYGPQSDMWSLGCMMFEMLTGEEAFPSREENDRRDLYRRIRHGNYDRYYIPLIICDDPRFILDFLCDGIYETPTRQCVYIRYRMFSGYREFLKDISPEAQDLISKILEPDPIKRYSASEALKHPWITGEGHFDLHKRHMPDVAKTFRDTFGKKSIPDRPGNMGPSVENTSGTGIFNYMFGTGN